MGGNKKNKKNNKKKQITQNNDGFKIQTPDGMLFLTTHISLSLTVNCINKIQQY